jgi:hypothetical protein
MSQDHHPLSEQFRLQARFSTPLYNMLLAAIADDLDQGGPATLVLAGHEQDRPGTVLPLRLMGALHRLVLTGRLPELSAYYPSVGGTEPAHQAWPTLAAVLDTRGALIRAYLDRPVQTNETGRSAQLFGGLLLVGERTGRPVRLLELGASAGLNLLVDRYRYDIAVNGGPLRTLGEPASPLRFERPWDGVPPADLSRPVVIAERAGCDPRPIDPADPDGRLTLESFVWADDMPRLGRLRAALEVAAEHRPPVTAADATRWLATQLAEPHPGVTTLVWHSVVWQYVDRAERPVILRALGQAAERASQNAPFAYLRYEPRQAPPRYSGVFELRVSLWPAGPVDQVIATGAGHGIPARWSQ